MHLIWVMVICGKVSNQVTLHFRSHEDLKFSDNPYSYLGRDHKTHLLRPTKQSAFDKPGLDLLK